ncbi:hypothetical protein AGMMS49546_22730 [Spirochaetia bacterium]|nr:hypothetical protein AGMMS49546_22730 [Spirochaetia bacterium]
MFPASLGSSPSYWSWSSWGGTAYAFFLKPEKAPGPIGAGSVNPGGAAPPAPGALTAADIFTGVGRLRIAVNSGEPATVLLSITFPYPGADRAFTEELAGKAPEFRSIAAAYFAALSPAELLSLDEAKAKAEILRRYNAELRLGKIEVLYFNDYMLLE